MTEKLKKQTETISIKETQSFVKKEVKPHLLFIDRLGISISNSAGIENPTITKSALDDYKGIVYSTKIQQVLDEKYKDVEDFTRSTQHYTRNLMVVISSNVYKLTDNIDRRALISSLYMVRDYVELVDNIQPYRTIFGGKEMFLKSAAQSLILALKSSGYQRLMQNVTFNE